MLDWINLGVQEKDRIYNRFLNRNRDLNRFLSILHRSYRSGGYWKIKI